MRAGWWSFVLMGAFACAAVVQVDKDTDTDADVPGDTDTDTDTDVVVDTDTDVETDTDTDTSPPAPECTLGTGEDAFEPVVDGQELTVVRGLQGGWHVTGAVVCYGIEPGGSLLIPQDLRNPDNPRVWWQITDPLTDEVVGGYPYPDDDVDDYTLDTPLRRPMSTSEGPLLVNEILRMWTRWYAEAVDRDVVIRFHLEDIHGVVIDRSVQVRLVPEEGWEPADTSLPEP